jgi:hypothetical protein
MQGTDVAGSVVTGLAAIAVCLLLFLLLRRVVLWYWALDKIEKHLAEIAALMRESAGRPRT